MKRDISIKARKEALKKIKTMTKKELDAYLLLKEREISVIEEELGLKRNFADEPLVDNNKAICSGDGALFVLGIKYMSKRLIGDESNFRIITIKDEETKEEETFIIPHEIKKEEAIKLYKKSRLKAIKFGAEPTIQNIVNYGYLDFIPIQRHELTKKEPYRVLFLFIIPSFVYYEIKHCRINIFYRIFFTFLC